MQWQNHGNWLSLTLSNPDEAASFLDSKGSLKERSPVPGPTSSQRPLPMPGSQMGIKSRENKA